MASTETESGLRFDFPDGVDCQRIDLPGTPHPDGWKRVDLLVERDGEALLLEVKNPSQPGATPASKADFALRLATNQLVPDLVRKFRDTYCYLHLMARVSAPVLAVFVVGEGLDDALLLAFTERLLGKLRQEGPDSWAFQYARDCLVLTPAKWEATFPEYALTVL